MTRRTSRTTSRRPTRCAKPYGASVALIHHCGVNGDRPRGFTGMSGAADAQISVKRDAANNIVATVEFLKDGAEGDVIVSRLKVVEIGKDEFGAVITSCIVEGVEGAPAAARQKEKRLPDAQILALKLLSDALNSDKAEIPPENERIPPKMLCIPESVWRDYCYRGGISKGEERAQRLAFQRAAEALVAADRVGSWDDWVWLR